MASKIGETNSVLTQIGVGGFEDYVTAQMLLEYFDDEIGLAWRCRLKNSSTPVESYPDYNVDCKKVLVNANYEKVVRHAFVHFEGSRRAKSAVDAASQGKLVMGTSPLIVNLGPENPRRMNERSTTTPFKFEEGSLQIGILRNQNEFLVGWEGAHNGVDFLVDPFTGTCKFLFTKDTAFQSKNQGGYAVIKCNYMIEFMLREINQIRCHETPSSKIVLLNLASSPKLFYRTADDDIAESVPFDLLDDDDPWIRTTDFTQSGAIGRCNVYRVSIRPRYVLTKALDYLRSRRVPFFQERKGYQLKISNEPDFGVIMSDFFFCIQYKAGISFQVLYMTNAVIHKGIINQHQMSENFFDLLRSQPEELNVAALRHMYTEKHPVNNACEALKRVWGWLLKNPKLIEKPQPMEDMVEVRRLIITPSKAYCLPPEWELSNRVLRNYRNIADRFLRVSFMDEAMQTLNNNILNCYASPIVRDLNPRHTAHRTTVFKRVRDMSYQGFYLCGRKYSFLAFSANQLRDRSAWFFAEDKNYTVASIKSWMGKFTNNIVAKCAARMGQCFSSTYATVNVPREVTSLLEDIERNNYVFSDGIGMISPDLAMEVAEKLQLSMKPPCAYQIRYAGFKGVVACWPTNNGGHRLSLRPSMLKFESTHTMLEICSWSRFQPGFLNRQIITLLSALNVGDQVFSDMQETMVSRLMRIPEDANLAFDVVTRSCLDLGTTAAIMLSAGFEPKTEPHLHGMLTSIKAAQLGDLRDKARIFVPSGRWLMGCLDELGVLEQGQCFIQVSTPSLEDYFVNHGSKFCSTGRKFEVVKGLVAIAKNPCLHPGDVRILEAVHVPGLENLYDCLVFPQKGDRPHTNEASGSDLDGDLYFVTWDENLIPPSKKSWMPMEYAPAAVHGKMRRVTEAEIINFFTTNMVNDTLGTICNAHVVCADLSEHGALDEKCIKLAELAAVAVDFPKTGKAATMPHELKPKKYPDFMGKEDFMSYKSTKILGNLYRKIRDGYGSECDDPAEPVLPLDNIFYDKDLEIPGSLEFITDAWSYKCSYDYQLTGLLGLYKVNREEEIVTGHIWSMPKHNSKKTGELKERLKHAYNTLRKEFRKVFESMAPEFHELSDDEKNLMYERKASAWYQVTYHESWLKKSTMDDAGKTVMLSFAWIAADYLARIKIRQRKVENNISIKPIDSLCRYLADKL